MHDVTLMPSDSINRRSERIHKLLLISLHIHAASTLQFLHCITDLYSSLFHLKKFFVVCSFMAPPNNIVSHRFPHKLTSTSNSSIFYLSRDRNISVDGATTLSEVPDNITLSPFTSIPHISDSSSYPEIHLFQISKRSVSGFIREGIR